MVERHVYFVWQYMIDRFHYRDTWAWGMFISFGDTWLIASIIEIHGRERCLFSFFGNTWFIASSIQIHGRDRCLFCLAIHYWLGPVYTYMGVRDVYFLWRYIIYCVQYRDTWPWGIFIFFGNTWLIASNIEIHGRERCLFCLAKHDWSRPV